jgi:hypothetical protein
MDKIENRKLKMSKEFYEDAQAKLYEITDHENEKQIVTEFLFNLSELTEAIEDVVHEVGILNKTDINNKRDISYQLEMILGDLQHIEYHIDMMKFQGPYTMLERYRESFFDIWDEDTEK